MGTNFEFRDAEVLWKIVKESDDSTEDSNGVPWILTDEAVELFDWSAITGKLLDTTGNIQFWNPEKKPTNSGSPEGTRRVVGDERGNLKAEPAGGMTRVLKEGFRVDGTFRYVLPPGSAPLAVEIGGLGFAPPGEVGEVAARIWAGSNPNERFTSVVKPGGTDGWKTYTSSGATKTYKWGTGRATPQAVWNPSYTQT